MKFKVVHFVARCIYIIREPVTTRRLLVFIVEGRDCCGIVKIDQTLSNSLAGIYGIMSESSTTQ